MAALNADPDFNAKKAAYFDDPANMAAHRAGASAQMTAQWKNPDLAERFIAGAKKWAAEFNARPEVVESARKRMTDLHADPAFASIHLAAVKKLPHVDIPRWVPRDLWGEFVEVAALHGEEAGARHVRQLKAEAAKAPAPESVNVRAKRLERPSRGEAFWRSP